VPLTSTAHALQASIDAGSLHAFEDHGVRASQDFPEYTASAMSLLPSMILIDRLILAG